MFSWKIDKNSCILFIRIFRFSTLNDMRVKKIIMFSNGEQSHPWEKTTWKTICIQNGWMLERDGHTAKHFLWEIDSISRWASVYACVSVRLCGCVSVLLLMFHAIYGRMYACISVWLNMVVRLYWERPFLMHLLVFVASFYFIRMSSDFPSFCLG